MKDFKHKYQDENYARLKYLTTFMKEYRLQLGLTQEELAEYAELNRSSVIRLERGTPVSLLTLFKYASALELPLTELFLEVD